MTLSFVTKRRYSNGQRIIPYFLRLIKLSIELIIDKVKMKKQGNQMVKMVKDKDPDDDSYEGSDHGGLTLYDHRFIC